METRKILTILVLALGLMVCEAKLCKAAPMGTAFTYQGYLYDANHPANDIYDLQFKLYDAVVGGGQVGSNVNTADVDVIDGYFTVELDFGAVFEGYARWLEIGVRPGEMNDPNVYTVLEPRQELTPAPYAMHSENADKLDSFDSSAFASSGHDHDGDYVNEGQVNSITSAMIQDNSVSSSEIVDGMVTNADIANNAITSSKMSDNSVSSSQIVDGMVTNADIATNAITLSKMQDNSVSSSKIVDGMVTNADIATNAINSAKIQNGTVTSSDIADGTITTADLAFTPLTNPYTGNLSITGNLDLTGFLDMDMFDIDNVDDVEADMIMAERIYLGYNYGSDGTGKGYIWLYDEAGNKTIELDSDRNVGGSILVKRATGTEGVRLDAGSYGSISVFADNGWCNIQLIGGFGSGGGSVRVNGSQVHDYADVYSFVSSANPLPGQVVSIATDGKLDISSTAYDSKVAGIVSGGGDLSPGMIIGGDKGDPHTAPIAVSGRVYCYVDATEQAVEIGDLLTTSNNPGYAMKAMDRERAFGAVLGKAMQPLPRGEKGLVLVLVCLN